MKKKTILHYQILQTTNKLLVKLLNFIEITYSCEKKVTMLLCEEILYEIESI